MADKPRFSSQDQNEFASFEHVIDQWLDGIVDAGNALLAIKQRKLYLISEHATFEEYVRARYGKTRQWAYDEINRAIVLTETGHDLPTSVAQPLKGLDRKTKNEVVTEAAQIAKKMKRETPSRKDVEAAIAATPAAAKKAKPALKVFEKEFQQVHRLTLYTTHREELLQIVQGIGDDVKVTVGEGEREPILIECDTLASLGLSVFQCFDEMPSGTRYEFSVHGEIVRSNSDKKTA